MKLHIVTDATADISEGLIKAFGVEGRIHIIPLRVHFGESEYRVGVDITTDAFYERLVRSSEMPRTSQPSPADFVDLYTRISSPGDTIVSCHISSKMSGTYQSALLAARQVTDRRIEVIDTRTASLGLGLIALQAARLAAGGADVDAVLREIHELMAGVLVFFMVDTLEYLHKNGRIGKAQALVGGILNLKPILTVEDGVVAPLAKARGRARARAALLERAALAASSGKVQMMGIVHARAPEDAVDIRQELAPHFPGVQSYIGEIGPVVGTHTGPGTLGVVLLGR